MTKNTFMIWLRPHLSSKRAKFFLGGRNRVFLLPHPPKQDMVVGRFHSFALVPDCQSLESSFADNASTLTPH